MAWRECGSHGKKREDPGSARGIIDLIKEHEDLAYRIGNLTPQEFYSMTPAEFIPWIEAKIKADSDRINSTNARAGTICAAFWNLYRDEVKHPDPYTAADFFDFGPSPKEQDEIPDECPADRVVRKMRARIQHQGGPDGA